MNSASKLTRRQGREILAKVATGVADRDKGSEILAAVTEYLMRKKRQGRGCDSQVELTTTLRSGRKGANKMVKPYPKQAKFFLENAKYVAYGGARGGGKSWAAR